MASPEPVNQLNLFRWFLCQGLFIQLVQVQKLKKHVPIFGILALGNVKF